MAVLKNLADVLDEYRTAKKTGALYVSVAEASENLIRFYFHDGAIYSVSYGTAKDRECLDILGCYKLGKAVYFDGMKIPAPPAKLPETAAIIDAVRKAGQQVQLDR